MYPTDLTFQPTGGESKKEAGLAGDASHHRSQSHIAALLAGFVSPSR
jgi:hypothetical protein